MAYKGIDGYKKRACSSVRTLDNYDFYIMPIVNPDGTILVSSTNSSRQYTDMRRFRLHLHREPPLA